MAFGIWTSIVRPLSPIATRVAAPGVSGEVTVVAPERDRSGASNSLTLDRPLSLKRTANGFHHVNGTPTDCVHLAVTGVLEHQPDMVVSGINLGANMGDDTIYSGTVAAATEGFLLGIPSLWLAADTTDAEAVQRTRLAQQLRESQRRIDVLNDRLEAMRAIERSLTPRAPAPGARPLP